MLPPEKESPWRRLDRWAAGHLGLVLTLMSLSCGLCAAGLQSLRTRPAAAAWLGAHAATSALLSLLQGMLVVAFVPGAIVSQVWVPGIGRELERKDRPAVRASVLIGALLLLLAGIVAATLLGRYNASL